MNVLIAGGSGFVGSRLIPELRQRGHNVRCYDLVVNPNFADITIQGDVRDVDAYTEAAQGCDTIINLAAQHRDDVKPIELYHSVNVDGATHTVEVARRCGITRIIFTSTVAVYGLDSGTSVETDQPRPFNEYGRTKLAAEEVFRSWQKETNGTLTIVRPCVIFGENNRGNVYTLMKQIASGKFLIVGDGHNRKSMAYVGNVAAFLAHQVEHAQGYTLINYGDKPDLTTNELVTTIRNALDQHRFQNIKVPLWLGLLGGYAFDGLAVILRKPLPVSSVRIRKFAASTIVGTEQLEESDFRRPFTIEEGLRRTVRAEFKAEL
ncbi:NAD-dependent epimerase/dehydratase family protein [Schaalia suimastitidis]|uniref:NAD-dependent epimerase/dehydratase family protein n=1 Tax=Schaalia suimastitidis TaxID=121163 RepID=UPI0004080C52|nr:NAD(P)-dependent oxidoreductase [Schaalia suimastitidis]